MKTVTAAACLVLFVLLTVASVPWVIIALGHAVRGEADFERHLRGCPLDRWLEARAR